MHGMTNEEEAAEVRELLRRALALLDGRLDHVAGAHVAQALASMAESSFRRALD